MNKYEKITQTLRYIDNPIYISNHDGEIIELMNKAADALTELQAENKALRNELCYKCGQYREAHNGSCDGCKWRKE